MDLDPRSSMTAPDHIASARAAFDRHAWAEAYDAFRPADGEVALGSADLEGRTRRAPHRAR